MSKLYSFPVRAVKQGLLNTRKLHMAFDEHFISLKSRSKTPKLFNLDLHISVMRDIQQELNLKNLECLQWSISGSNRFSRSIYKISDPVDVVNSQSWNNLDEDLISLFEDRYKKFLSKFDGFIVTHTPALSQLYRSFGKPILVINSTRYEAPYTNNINNWNNLDNYLIKEVGEKKILLASNNLGDSDYLKYRTNISSQVVPSFCEYTNVTWIPGGTQKVIVSRSPELENFIEDVTSGEWRSFRKVMGSNYKWKQYFGIKEVLYIPYNISTMFLFELATAGIPVSVPSKKFLKVISENYSGVLSELSYFQVQGLPAEQLAKDDPNNYSSSDFQNWWLDRADFYNSDLMPNVREISDFGELKKDRDLPGSYLDAISQRNSVISKKRGDLISSFSELL